MFLHLPSGEANNYGSTNQLHHDEELYSWHRQRLFPGEIKVNRESSTSTLNKKSIQRKHSAWLLTEPAEFDWIFLQKWLSCLLRNHATTIIFTLHIINKLQLLTSLRRFSKRHRERRDVLISITRERYSHARGNRALAIPELELAQWNLSGSWWFVPQHDAWTASNINSSCMRNAIANWFSTHF